MMSLESLNQFADLTSKTMQEVLELAKAHASYRPLEPYPGWFFDIEWESADPQVHLRRAIWNYFYNLDQAVSIPFAWHYGLTLNLWLGNDLSRQLYVSGCYEPNELYCLSQLLQPGMVFLDVGANDGWYSLFAAQKVGETGQVVAFEPSDREFERLQQNVQFNQLSQIKTLNIALGDTTAQMHLKVADAEHAGQNTLGQFSYSAIQEVGLQTVSIYPLDIIVAGEAISRVDVIKIDIEGAEHAFLTGAKQTLLQHYPLLLIELLEPALAAQGSSIAVVLDFLIALGYEVFTLSHLTGLPLRVMDVDHDQPSRPAAWSLSNNVVAAHPKRRWAWLDSLQTASYQHRVLLRADQQYHQVQVALHQAQTSLRQMQTELQAAHCIEQLISTELAQTQAVLEVLKNRINAMESSKFWQIRSGWVRLKGLLGLGDP
jgi:FkbM family methyltransferase